MSVAARGTVAEYHVARLMGGLEAEVTKEEHDKGAVLKKFDQVEAYASRTAGLAEIAARIGQAIERIFGIFS